MRRMLTAPNIVLGLLCAMYLILYVDRVNIATAAPLIQKELGLSNTQLGLAFSAFAYPYALFQLLGGWLGNRFGARRGKQGTEFGRRLPEMFGRRGMKQYGLFWLGFTQPRFQQSPFGL